MPPRLTLRPGGEEGVKRLVLFHLFSGNSPFAERE